MLDVKDEVTNKAMFYSSENLKPDQRQSKSAVNEQVKHYGDKMKACLEQYPSQTEFKTNGTSPDTDNDRNKGTRRLDDIKQYSSVWEELLSGSITLVCYRSHFPATISKIIR